MEDEGIDIPMEALSKLTPTDQRDVQQFLQQEAQKAQVHKSIHELSETCFKKCITSSISSGKLASKEETCMANCVDRFMDSNFAVLKHLDKLRAAQ